jgi:hypothetical protein
MRNLTLTALLLTACAGRYTAFTPATASAPPDAFNKAVRVLVEHGESIETKDEGAGILTTAWKEQEFMGSTKRLRWTITVASGTVTVNSQCQSKLSGEPAPGQTNAFEDCGNQPGERNDEAKRIADEIAR